MNDRDVKKEVRHFYDQIGWKVETGDVYQNAHYEDLRPVAAEYIHRCHLRVGRHLKPDGKYLLDAGSGPIQYPEYLTYSKGYQKRVCVDLSIVALKEARTCIRDHGLFVVADVANLPFKEAVFDGAVSLHTFHHLPSNEHRAAYQQIHHILCPKSTAVIVNGWTDSSLMRRSRWLVLLMERLIQISANIQGKSSSKPAVKPGLPETKTKEPTGTFTRKSSAAVLRKELNEIMDYEILTWRSVNVRFMRAVFHNFLGGRLLLRLLFWLEEQFPRYFGENGQYPLIVIRKD